MIETVAVVVQACFSAKVFCREPMAEEVRKRTRLRHDAPEVIVFVGGGHVAGFVDVLCDVAVVVESWEIELTVARNGKQTSHSARALERTGKVESPEVLYLGRVGRASVNYRNGLVNQVPIVVYERAVLDGVPLVRLDRRRRRRSCGDGQPLNRLRYSAVTVVAGVQDADRAVGEVGGSHGKELIFRVVGIVPVAVGG